MKQVASRLIDTSVSEKLSPPFRVEESILKMETGTYPPNCKA
jgi:hypothetical protein